LEHSAASPQTDLKKVGVLALYYRVVDNRGTTHKGERHAAIYQQIL
jgi:hypothetical protein